MNWQATFLTFGTCFIVATIFSAIALANPYGENSKIQKLLPYIFLIIGTLTLSIGAGL